MRSAIVFFLFIRQIKVVSHVVGCCEVQSSTSNIVSNLISEPPRAAARQMWERWNLVLGHSFTFAFVCANCDQAICALQTNTNDDTSTIDTREKVHVLLCSRHVFAISYSLSLFPFWSHGLAMSLTINVSINCWDGISSQFNGNTLTSIVQIRKKENSFEYTQSLAFISLNWMRNTVDRIISSKFIFIPNRYIDETLSSRVDCEEASIDQHRKWVCVVHCHAETSAFPVWPIQRILI